MHPVFKLNEIFKETMCLEYGAQKAISVLHENGGKVIKEPFLETEIIWENHENISNSDILMKIAGECMDLMDLVKEQGGYMTYPIWEIKNKQPVLAWAQFLDKSSENLKFL